MDLFDSAPNLSGFPQWYATYPKRRDPDDAEKAYRQVVPRRVSAEELLKATEAFACMCRVKSIKKEFIKYPATWLRKGSWANDELLEFMPSAIIPKPLS